MDPNHQGKKKRRILKIQEMKKVRLQLQKNQELIKRRTMLITLSAVSSTINAASNEVNYGNPQMDLQEKGGIDSGLYMTGNMSYLTDYKEIDGGFVDFGGTFYGKSDEGFFVEYSLHSKAFRVFNSRTRIVEETLHIRFSENTPNNVGSGPNWLFDIDALTKTMNYQPVVIGKQSNGNAGTKDDNNAEPKSSQDVGFKPSNDVGKKVNEAPRQKNEFKDQEEKDSVNNTNRVNAVSLTVNAASNKVNAVGRKSSIELHDDLNMPELENISIFEDSNEDVFGAVKQLGI
nr:ribonuclease H-like domain-containing protein [Tanacetum cinerariifolium]